jgi:predicted RecB family nuclease
MQLWNGQIQVSASDLSNHLACRHLTSLDLLAAQGKIERIHRTDPSLDVLIERGFRHEAAYLDHLRAKGLNVLGDDENLRDERTRVQRTNDAMRAGFDAIAQADLQDGRWRGRADVLLKIPGEKPNGRRAYEVVDTKLARETRGGTILQLCLYSELLAKTQGTLPQQMHVVSPGREFKPETFRTHDFMAYYRLVKSRLEAHVAAPSLPATYPEAVEQCDICRWWTACNDRRRTDDHLSFVAGISGLQITQLHDWGATTLTRLAALSLPLEHRPDRGAPESYVKVREQARLQVQRRETDKPFHELLAPEAKHGLARLPEPSAGDIFLDFEGDPFVEGGGLEYLLGYVSLNDPGEPTYTALWALDRASERRMFESFIDAVMERRLRFPNLHVYHFTHYEPSALKRLMGRYATREDEIDRLLRAGTFIDLHGITRQSLRASVEKYSLKDLEAHFGFDRQTDLRDARRCLRHLECALELDEPDAASPEVCQIVEAYNREDCLSAWHLRNWLESLRDATIPRPALEPGDPSEKVDERRKRVLELAGRLLQGIPNYPAERTREQEARWLLAHMLEWHRREEKAPWWEYFRLRELTDEERLEERAGLSGLEFVSRVGGTAKCPIDRYRFPAQDMQIRQGDDLHTSQDDFGEVEEVDVAARTIDVKKRQKTADVHPTSVFAHTSIGAPALAESLYRIGSWVAEHGVDAPGSYRAGRDLLLRHPPRMKSGSLYEDARAAVLQLDNGMLPIQGPPGAGKTYTAARMICSLLKTGKKIGITAVSHKVIRKLLEETLDAAKAEGVSLRCIQKLTEKSRSPNPAIPETTDNKRVLAALQNREADIAAGTAWLWARPDMAEAVDVLFVDEAGQMSLADVIAVSQGAKNLVLLGDPQQLEQPIQGTHPPGVDVSALQHILGKSETMPPELGLFLDETWRLAPSICDFTSELFYNGRLKSHEGLEHQTLRGPTRYAGSGVHFVPVAHEGNQSSSSEEVAAVEQIVRNLLHPEVTWINRKGEEQRLTGRDILIVAPYNAHVFDLAARIPGLHIGTVDKFQGQEAPVVIYSMATSSPEDAPRGMEFLYSLNRFNVATSRAQCVCIVVASPRLLEPECQTPRQMKLANVLCRYFEMANSLVAEKPEK